jgi:hypothetical protein
MTLVYQRNVPAGPAMHAFVVGCGSFPNLPAEMDANRQSCSDSARSFVGFLVDKADKFRAKLASIEVLLSDPGGNNTTAEQFAPYDPRASTAVDSATSANVQSAGVRWMGRCRKGDHLIFYGCAHGVTDRDESALMLLEDVWDNPNARWEKCLNVAGLAKYLPAATGAGACWVFLDACQELQDDVVNQLDGVSGIQLVRATVRQMQETCVRSVSVAAARYGTLTLAPRNGGIAQFTRALLEGLGNCCVEQTINGWEVSSKELLNGAIRQVGLACYGDNLEPVSLNTAPGDNYFLLAVDDPQIPIMVTTVPESLMLTATGMQRTCANGLSIPWPGGTSNPVWRFPLAVSSTKVTVEAVLEGSRSVKLEIPARPPCQIVKLQ